MRCGNISRLIGRLPRGSYNLVAACAAFYQGILLSEEVKLFFISVSGNEVCGEFAGKVLLAR